ncbi:MAG: CarD family transcriptional regulator [Lachnospiraceae bacterium]|nr:CarD family transcriptional regulator [Lachnospiraceae bacterium]
MWREGDYVLHGSDGVCVITDVQKLDLTGDGAAEYYILEPLYKKGLTVYVETSDSEDSLKKPMDRQEIEQMIGQIPEYEMSWISNERERQDTLGRMLREGELQDLFRVVAVLYRHRQELLRRGKKMRASDEQFLQRADSRINRELAYGIGVAPEQVPQYIRERIEKEQQK